MLDSISKFFTKEPEKEETKFFKRKEIPRVELIREWDVTIASYDKEINSFKSQIAVIDEKLRTIHDKYGKYKNKQSPQAVALKNEGTNLMSEKQKLEARKSNFEQQKSTAIVSRDNLSSIDHVAKLNALTQQSTQHIQQEVEKIDLLSAKASAGQARKTNKTVGQVSAYIINPFNIDLEEDANAFGDAFDNLAFGEDEFISEEEEILFPSTRTTTSPQNITNKPKAVSQSILDDDLF